MTVWNRSRRGSARRGLAITATSALLAALLIPGIAFGEHRENTTELEAADEVGAALEWSSLFDSASSVAIGRDDLFADNLASGLIQGLGDGVPLLLTPTDALDADVADEIERLGATAAHILGGTSAISADVEDELEDMGLTIHRHAGASRVETAVDIASKHGAAATTAIVARAFASGADATQAFADSLAAGAWAAEAGYPILLTQTNELHSAVANHLAASDVEDVFVVGGTSAVSDNVVSQIEALGIDVTRVSGPTRFDTAVEIANARGFDDSSDATDGVILVDGQSSDAWADGFAAAAYASNPKPIVLSNSAADELPQATQDFLVPGEVDLICGSSVPDDDCDDAAEELGHELVSTTNQAFAVTPADDAAQTVSTSTTSTGARSYSANVGSASSVRITLVPTANVTRGADGTVTFSSTAAIAQTSNSPAIETVNGAAVGPQAGNAGSLVTIGSIAPQNGVVTFSVDSTVNTSFIPVVFSDTDNDGALDLVTGSATSRQPSEPFGIGGAANFVPTEATVGTLNGEVRTANVAMNYLIVDNTGQPAGGFNDADSDDVTAYYDANDVFRYQGVGISIEAFERLAIDGAEFNGSYAPDSAGVSTFDIQVTQVPAPITLTTTVSDIDGDGSRDDVTVAWALPAGSASGFVFDVARDNVTANDTIEDAEIQANDTSSMSVQLLNQPNGTYNYLVRTVEPTSGLTSTTTAGTDVTVPQVDTQAPTVMTAGGVQDVDGGFEDILDAGDVFVLHLSEPVQVANNAAIIVSDGTDSGVLTNGQNATFSLNTSPVAGLAAGRVLTITVNAAVLESPSNDVVGAGTYTLTNRSGITDNAGNALALTGDSALEDDGPEVLTATGTTGQTTVTVRFNEAMNAASIAAADISYDADGAGGGAAETPTNLVVDADGRTVTFTVTAITAGTSYFTIAAGNVADTDGQTNGAITNFVVTAS